MQARPNEQLTYNDFLKSHDGMFAEWVDGKVVAHKNTGRLHNMYLEGPADVAVEIVSPESGARDRGEKFYEYEAGGVREFWLIDPIRQQTEFYLLGEDKLFHHVSPGADGIYRSTVIPGFWFKVAWLWEQPLRPVAEVLKELKLVA